MSKTVRKCSDCGLEITTLRLCGCSTTSSEVLLRTERERDQLAAALRLRARRYAEEVGLAKTKAILDAIVDAWVAQANGELETE